MEFDWEKDIIGPEKESHIVYAYILEGEETPFVCSKETLFEKVAHNHKVAFIATPETATFVIPGTDYFTFQVFLNEDLRKALQNFKIYGLLCLVLTIILTIELLSKGFDHVLDKYISINFIFVPIFLIFPFVSGAISYFRLRKLNESNYAESSKEIRFKYWLNSASQLWNWVILGVLGLIFAIQLYIGLDESVEIAGLDKVKFWEGQYWRMLTAVFLHGSVLHIIFNLGALYFLIKIMFRITSFYHFAVIFLTTAIFGSMASIIFLPDATSVGASGGLMGLIGFLIVIGLKFRPSFPFYFTKILLEAVVLTGVIGVLASESIDNSAHAGGLVAGGIMGLLYTRQKLPFTLNTVDRVVGMIAITVLLSITGLVFGLLL